VDELYVASRRALLDALEALADQTESVVLIGAHAVYVYTGEGDVPIATRTKDSDLALDPSQLQDSPLLEEAMSKAGFHRNLEGGQPGEWISADGIPVDLLVPESMVPSKGRRSAQIPPHSPLAARKVAGLEAAVIDNRELWVEALGEDDRRRVKVRVASPAALAVSKAHKLGERQTEPGRLIDKDAHDLYRLLVAVETAEMVEGFLLLLADPRSAEVAEQALVFMTDLLAAPDSIGSLMAGRVEEGVGEPENVAASVSILARELIEGVAAARG
jgi:hypothetical protein